MLFSVRQNSLENYARLPIWFVTVGSLFLLMMMILLCYQAIYLETTPVKDIKDNWRTIIKALYCVGLISPILNYCFIYFLITRMNEKVRSESNPNFRDSFKATMEDGDDRVFSIDKSSSPVAYEDLRKDYTRRLVNDSNATGNTLTPPYSPTDENINNSGF